MCRKHIWRSLFTRRWIQSFFVRLEIERVSTSQNKYSVKQNYTWKFQAINSKSVVEFSWPLIESIVKVRCSKTDIFVWNEKIYMCLCFFCFVLLYSWLEMGPEVFDPSTVPFSYDNFRHATFRVIGTWLRMGRS